PELLDQAMGAGADDVLHKNEPASRMLARAVLYSLDRIRAEAHRERIEQLILESPDGVIVTDTVGRVLFVNQAALDLFGRTEQDFVGELLGFSIQDGQTLDIDVIRGQERRTAELRVVECRWHHTDGFLATIRDVTDRNRMSEHLRHKQKLEAIGQLAGGVAHDFNNLLTVILSRADVAIEGADVSTETRVQLEGIQRASLRAATLTRQLLTFARRQSSEMSVLNLNDVVRNMQHMLGRLIGEHIQVELMFDPDLPRVLADPDQLGQALTNLSLNARDAMVTGGRLTLSTSTVELAEAESRAMGLSPGRHVRLTVTDTGHGIPREVRERIFEPFFTTKAERGTGLGLSMVHGIVTQSGGHIRVLSEPGQGATFEIYLPPVIEDEIEDTPPARVQTCDGHERILLVEDEPDVREVAAAMLSRFGYTVVTAPDGNAAFEIWSTADEPFALVLTDIVMAGMSGWELGEKLKSVRPDQRVLFMSGYSDEVLADHGVVESSIPLVLKPFTSADLARSVRRMLDGPPLP
nr:response regulator [Acidobacteriota bacterium]